MIIGVLHFSMLSVFAAMSRRFSPNTVRAGNRSTEAAGGTAHAQPL